MWMAYRGITTVLLHVVLISYGIIPGALGVGDTGLEADRDTETSPDFTEQWAVHITGGERHARDVADQTGFKFVKKLIGHDEHYLFEREDHPVRSKRSGDHHTESLLSDYRVKWAEQQIEKRRVKRDFFKLERREESMFPSRDVLSTKQWYFRDADNGKSSHDVRATEKQVISLDVVSVWKRGFTGANVTVTVLDDGLEQYHTDLKDNYCPEASTDLNDMDDDPTPRYDPTNENRHGTRCAGEIAMQKNNGICGVGVAYNCNIGGVRMLDGRVTDSLEAEALNTGMEVVDIMSASWGPNDDGSTVEGPGTLASQALEKGITQGRGGKGIVYVWASGNGGGSGDNCNCDGYTGSIYTLSISSASQHCKSPWYSESCPSTIATTYSSGNYQDASIVTTDLKNECTDQHTGTSAAAPLAAGIMALLLEANNKLTWRDIQWIVAYTANYEALGGNTGWMKNDAGFKTHLKFGFGLLDADQMVVLALEDGFKSVPDKTICVTDVADVNPDAVPQDFSSGDEVVIKITTQGCADEPNEINYLEHVQIYVNITHTRRGNLAIFLKSPSAENATQLLTNRVKDNSSAGFQSWPFMSVHQWGENPRGTWEIIIQDNGEEGASSGTVNGVELVLHGVRVKPWIMEHKGVRTYYEDMVPVDQELCNERGTTEMENSASGDITL